MSFLYVWISDDLMIFRISSLLNSEEISFDWGDRISGYFCSDAVFDLSKKRLTRYGN